MTHRGYGPAFGPGVRCSLEDPTEFSSQRPEASPMPTKRLIPVVVPALVLAGTALLSSPPGVGAPAEGTLATTRVVKGGQATKLVNSAGSPIAPAVGPEAGEPKAPVANRSLSSKAQATRNPDTLSGIPAASTGV